MICYVRLATLCYMANETHDNGTKRTQHNIRSPTRRPFQANHLTHFCLYGRASDYLWWCLTCVSRAHNTSTPDFNIYGILMANIMYKIEPTFQQRKSNVHWCVIASALVDIPFHQCQGPKSSKTLLWSCSALYCYGNQSKLVTRTLSCSSVATNTTFCNILVKY